MNPTKEITQYIFQMRRKIGKQLHTQREMQGLSLSEAANLSGISIERIELIEQGRHFSLHKVALVAALYNSKIDINIKHWKKHKQKS